MSRWVEIALPESYVEFNYTELLLKHILPILDKYEGRNINCVYAFDNYTDFEVKFKNEVIAKKAIKELNTLFKKLTKESPDMLMNTKDTHRFKVDAYAKLMDKDYEKNGAPIIVRPDNSFDKSVLKNFKKCKLPTMKKTKKNNK